MSKRDTYVARTQLQLDELDRKLSALSDQAQHAKDDLRERFEHGLAVLRADSRAAAAQLDAVKAAGDDGWHKLVSEMERLRHAFSNSFAPFRSLT